MPTSFWRSDDAKMHLSRLDRSGFAVEFLRRNPTYRREYIRTIRQIARGEADPEEAKSALARRWGLSFRP